MKQYEMLSENIDINIDQKIKQIRINAKIEAQMKLKLYLNTFANLLPDLVDKYQSQKKEEKDDFFNMIIDNSGLIARCNSSTEMNYKIFNQLPNLESDVIKHLYNVNPWNEYPYSYICSDNLKKPLGNYYLEIEFTSQGILIYIHYKSVCYKCNIL